MTFDRMKYDREYAIKRNKTTPRIRARVESAQGKVQGLRDVALSKRLEGDAEFWQRVEDELYAAEQALAAASAMLRLRSS